MDIFSPLRSRPVRKPDGIVFGSVEAMVRSMCFTDASPFQNIEYEDVDMNLATYNCLSQNAMLNGVSAKIIAQSSDAETRGMHIFEPLSFYIYVSACLLQFCQHPLLGKRAVRNVESIEKEARACKSKSSQASVLVAARILRERGNVLSYKAARSAFLRMEGMLQRGEREHIPFFDEADSVLAQSISS